MRALLGLLAFLLPATAADTFQVFILAGQSNMVGHAKNKLFEHQATDPKTRDHFAPYRKDGDWITRDDVMIDYFDRTGGLTLGYGARDKTGPELGFGKVVGDAIDEPVLLIKVAWGGRSIYRDFRPPSAGLPSEEKLEAELEKARERTRKQNEKHQRNDPLPTLKEIKSAYGKDYRAMLEEVRGAIAGAPETFPALKGRRPALAGFVWFQGWNDKFGGADQEYADNLAHLIRDVRRDLESPRLPVVIGVMGQNGSKAAEGTTLTLQQAQLEVAQMEEFKDTVAAVRTDVLVDKAAEALYPTWKENVELWEKTGSDHGYHYLGSAIWMTRIGEAFGEAMLELVR